MSVRLQQAGLVALLVATLALVALALRTPTPPSQMSTRAPATSPSVSAQPESSSSPSVPAVIGAGAKVVFLGDSFAAGSGASAPGARWTSILSAENGWNETNLASAQTGYVRAGQTGTCTPASCPPFTGVTAKAVAAAPDLVVISGGANDLGVPTADVAAAVTRTIGEIRAGAPGARVVVINPWWDLRPQDGRLADYATVISRAATEAGATWIDTGQPLAGKRALMVDDGMQPNDQGHRQLAAEVTAALAQAGLIAAGA